jgi:hypothetical protein
MKQMVGGCLPIDSSPFIDGLGSQRLQGFISSLYCFYHVSSKSNISLVLAVLTGVVVYRAKSKG